MHNEYWHNVFRLHIPRYIDYELSPLKIETNPHVIFSIYLSLLREANTASESYNEAVYLDFLENQIKYLKLSISYK